MPSATCESPFVLNLGIAVTLGVAAELLIVVTLICTIVGVVTLPFSFWHPGLLAHAAIACLALRGLLLRRLRLQVLLVMFGVACITNVDNSCEPELILNYPLLNPFASFLNCCNLIFLFSLSSALSLHLRPF